MYVNQRQELACDLSVFALLIAIGVAGRWGQPQWCFTPTAAAAIFAGFWWSHVPRSRITEFLRGFHAALIPGSKCVLLDNRFVPGSSTPISERDAESNTYQSRRLSNGTVHRVLKNFPSRDDLFSTVAGLAQEVRYHEWRYYWALEYTSAP